jgi:protease II
MSINRIVVLILFVALSFEGVSQIVIEGRVYNDSKEELPYSTIILKKNKFSAVANEEGEFKILIDEKADVILADTLVVHHIGCQDYILPVFLGERKQIQLEITLEEKAEILKEIIVKEDNYLSADRIVKNVLKRVKHNYSNNPVRLLGHYRELVSENEKTIELNEALLSVNYAAYPQKRFTKKGFRHYYSDRFNPYSSSDVFMHLVFFPHYISYRDSVYLIQARKSMNLSELGIRANPEGGPFDLIANDKVKYGYDFLDNRLLDQYIYQRKTVVDKNGKMYYKISFEPRVSEGVYAQTFSQKMRYAIYSGYFIVDSDDFAITEIEYQLSTLADFGNRNAGLFIPVLLRGQIKYVQNQNGRYVLSSVKTLQSDFQEINGKKYVYACERDLILKETNASVKGRTISLKKNFNLRNEAYSYDPAAWEHYAGMVDGDTIPNKARLDLEKDVPLEEQFASVNLSVDSLKRNLGGLTPDWLQRIPFEFDVIVEDTALFNQTFGLDITRQIKEEKKYYSDVMSKWFKSLRRYYYSHNHFLSRPEPDSTASSEDSDIFVKQDTLGDYFVFLRGTKNRKVLNLSELHRSDANIYIDYAEKHGKYITVSFTKREGILKTILNIPIEGGFKTDTIADADDFVWISDTSIAYTLHNDLYRTDKLFERTYNAQGGVEEEIMTEEGRIEYDIQIDDYSSNVSGLLYYKECMDSSELYYWNKSEMSVRIGDTEKWADVEVIGSNKDTLMLNVLVDSQYKLVGAYGKDFSKYFELATNKTPFTQAVFTDNFLVVAVYKDLANQLLYFDKKSFEQNTVFLGDQRRTIELLEKDSQEIDVVSIEVENSITPYLKLDIRLNEQNSSYSLTDSIQYDTLNLTRASSNLTQKLLYVEQDGGHSIPISLLYNDNLKKGEYKGLVVKAYGAYSSTYYPYFRLDDVIYAMDSVVVAFVHVRGGGELGNSWYQQGIRDKKRNSYSDFKNATIELQKRFQIRPENSVGYGTSAGGIIMGLCANEPEPFLGGIILDKPFLDVLNSMCDSNLPLTTLEWKEWGNPINSEYAYSCLSALSPFQNITHSRNRPNLFFIAKYHDIQTPFWQILKAVLKYRVLSDNDPMILSRIDLNSGHYGSVDGADHMREKAEIYSFIQAHLKE